MDDDLQLGQINGPIPAGYNAEEAENLEDVSCPDVANLESLSLTRSFHTSRSRSSSPSKPSST
jgi:hypothetical protein